ncbi:MAG: (d)CMP kinase [Rikenellaceae bacterium]
MHTTLSPKGLIIALDGYSSCGKSTFAKSIATHLGYIFIDTGAMYRAVTFAAIRAAATTQDSIVELLPSLCISFRFNEERGSSDLYLNGELVDNELRTMEVSGMVSSVAAIGAVREKLVALQQSMGREGGVVMDGRDIGTVVFPDADIKIFMTADPKVRAQRRFEELSQKGDEVSFDEILENVVSRDRDDETRAISPLRRADDAILLDNSAMSVEEQMEWFDGLYQERCQR